MASVVVFCKWKYRSYKNLPALGAADARFSPGWAVGYYFVPIANLFMPFRAMKDLVNGSAGRRVKTASGPVTLWWVFHIAASLIEKSESRVYLRAETYEEYLVASVLGIVSSVLALVMLPLAIAVYREVDAAQLGTATDLGLEAAPQPPRFTIDR